MNAAHGDANEATVAAMNVDARVLFRDGEHAARLGDWPAARACFLDAAQSAAEVQLWRTAVRCYRHALELDLLDREVVERVLRMPARAIAGRAWDDYRLAIDHHPHWPALACRTASIVIGDLGAVIECPRVGPVLELFMPADDLIETRPDGRFAGMPVAMAMIIVRRAMWPVAREHAPAPASLRVTFEGQQRVRLDEHGEWEPVASRSRSAEDAS